MKKRDFLNPGEGMAAYQLEGEEDDWGVSLVISDCNRMITLDFSLHRYKEFKPHNNETHSAYVARLKSTLDEVRDGLASKLAKVRKLKAVLAEVERQLIERAETTLEALPPIGPRYFKYRVDRRKGKIVTKKS